jgi:hypothetical protein
MVRRNAHPGRVQEQLGLGRPNPGILRAPEEPWTLAGGKALRAQPPEPCPKKTMRPGGAPEKAHHRSKGSSYSTPLPLGSSNCSSLKVILRWFSSGVRCTASPGRCGAGVQSASPILADRGDGLGAENEMAVKAQVRRWHVLSPAPFQGAIHFSDRLRWLRAKRFTTG